MIGGAAAAQAAGVGGKAASLGRLIEAGFDVPAFLVIRSGERPGGLDEAVAALGAGPFAVRSSGLQEDGAADSHAGQFDTVLNVAAADVARAIEQVAASGAGEGVIAYRTQRGLGDAVDRPAVIVQVMVPADVAGVAFSADPVSGRRDRTVVSATPGLADSLVAGEIDGSSWWVDAGGRVVASTGDPDVLDAEALAQVVALAQRVATAFGGPQDIEWAIHEGRLHLLQARPITSRLRDAPVADRAQAVFDNSNIVESYPGIVSPLTFSFASYAYARVYMSFVALLGVPAATVTTNRTVFENMLVRVDARVYYNLGNWYRALALLPGYSLNRRYMETMMGVGAPLPDAVMAQFDAPPARGWGRVREYGRLASVAFGLVREGFRLPDTARDFRARLDRALAATTPARLEAMALTELAAEYRSIESDLLDRWDAPIVNDFLCMIAFGASRKTLERWLGPEGGELQNDVLIGQGDIISARPAQLIRAMGAAAGGDPALIAALEADDRRAVEASAIGPRVAGYIAEFGDRCTEELKLESVTLDEDPRALFAAVAASARRAAPPPPARAHDPFARVDAAFRGNPVKRIVARAMLGWAKARVRDRENLRYERTRIFGRARRLLLACGRQFHAHGVLDDPRDVFLLTIQEVLGAIEGFAATADLAGLANVRRAEASAAATRPDPAERILVDGPAFTATSRVDAPVVIDLATERSGTGCSAGKVRAVARVVRDPRTQSIASGEILVARNTDPGWIALFASASAIVVERGSLLSHSAIVARELGIPCVVGLSRATEWIADGDTIDVDGATGLVRKL